LGEIRGRKPTADEGFGMGTAPSPLARVSAGAGAPYAPPWVSGRIRRCI